MLFGNIQRFAIEYELHEHSAGEWMYGYACYWIGGKRVGDFGLMDSLRDLLPQWDRMSWDRNLRSNESLITLDTKSLIDTLFCGLYGTGCPDFEKYYSRGIKEEWARHNVGPSLGMFDSWNVFLVENALFAKCVYRKWGSDPYCEYLLDPGEFDEVLRSALKDLLRHYDEVRPQIPARLTEIYVGLVNDEANTYRKVPALKITYSLYLVAGAENYDPAIEKWEFPPGSYVNVIRRALASGPELIADSVSVSDESTGGL